MHRLSQRLLGSVHVPTSPSTPPCSPFPKIQRQFLLFPPPPNMDRLKDDISREKLIVDRCKKSIDRKEPYDLMSMKQQIDISLSKITALKMRLFHMQNNSTNHNNNNMSPSSNIKQQIHNTQLMYQGARKVRESLIKEESPNEKVLRETEQTILMLNEKLELLMQCSSQKVSTSTPISVRRSRDGTKKGRTLPVQVSGLLKIRVTGLSDLPNNVKPRPGRHASEYLAQAIKKKRSVFGRHGFRRQHRLPASNDYIVIIHVGGKDVATMVWNEKKTMVGGDEESIQLFKSRQLDFEVYHTDSRSLCAIGSMPLETLLDQHDAKSPIATFAHMAVDLIPQGSLYFQTAYSDPKQSMEKRIGENYIDGSSKLSLSVRKSGSILARGSQTRFNPRTAISMTQFLPQTASSGFARPRKVESMESYRVFRQIGHGAFGIVQLGQRIDDGMFCAIKIIDRDINTGKLETGELHVLNNINHPFICSLLASFIERDAIHLVLEFCEAGDLHTHLDMSNQGFTREQVTYFAASIVLAVEYLHRKMYVHRDLKTENMMLTRGGVLKVIDFGLCKKLSSRNEKLNEIVGTTTHLAAEVLRREPYGIEIDWWAVGVSLYQLRTRDLPFLDSRVNEMQRNSRVREWHTFNDLLVSLMALHPEARLGYYSTEDVKKHPFFMETDFDAVLNLTLPPPYVPLMSPNMDLRYFDYNAERNDFDMSYSSNSSTDASFQNNNYKDSTF